MTGTAPDEPNSTSAWDSARRAVSACDGQPSERMSAPSCLRRASSAVDGSLVAPFWVKDGTGLLVAFPGDQVKSATAESIATAVNTPGIIAMPVDNTAKRAMVATCRDAGDAHGNNARLVEFTSRLPMSSQLIVLTEALSRKFWLAPDLSESSITDWCRAFGMANRVDSLHWLAGRVFEESGMSGKQRVYRTEMFEAEEKAMAKVVEYGASAAMAAFEASTTLHSLWAGFEQIDEILRYRFLTTGEVCRAKPVRREGENVVAALSSPFKIREGRILVVSESDTSHLTRPATLLSLGFEDEHGLTGVIGKPGEDPRSSALPTLDGALAARESVLICEAPFVTPVKHMAMATRWADTSGIEGMAAIVRDVPLDVVLAGGPVER